MKATEPLPLLGEALTSSGLCLDQLRREAKAIALFGSRARGCAHAGSDWDLLCIGPGRAGRIGGLDIVWIDERRVLEAGWLSSDLAGHVGAHGTWLHGEQPWTAAEVLFGAAARRKEALVSQRARAVSTTWPYLTRPYRERAATLLRRDIQRLEHLRRATPVPPTALLDVAWRNSEFSRESLIEILTGLGAAHWMAAQLAAGREPIPEVA